MKESVDGSGPLCFCYWFELLQIKVDERGDGWRTLRREMVCRDRSMARRW